jgi:hypothetical protein
LSGIELKCARIKARMPQYILASQLGITQTELSSYENDRKILPLGIIERIMEAIRNWKNNQTKLEQ